MLLTGLSNTKGKTTAGARVVQVTATSARRSA